MRVYLAGPINACSDDEVTNWREQVKAAAWGLLRGVTWVNPVDRDFRGVEAETYESIVEGDKADVAMCDLVLAYCWKPSYGTAMEILYAHSKGVPVVAVVPEPQPISPWVQYHAQVVRTLDEAIDAILARHTQT